MNHPLAIAGIPAGNASDTRSVDADSLVSTQCLRESELRALEPGRQLNQVCPVERVRKPGHEVGREDLDAGGAPFHIAMASRHRPQHPGAPDLERLARVYRV